MSAGALLARLDGIKQVGATVGLPAVPRTTTGGRPSPSGKSMAASW